MHNPFENYSMKKKLRITVKGQTYDVIAEILDDEIASPARSASVPVAATHTDVPAAAPAPTAKSSAPAPAAQGDLPSPIAGTVVSVQKPVGSSVAEGDVVMVLEAMKMNTEVTAPGSGKVTAVHVAVGQNIEEGQALMTIA